MSQNPCILLMGGALILKSVSSGQIILTSLITEFTNSQNINVGNQISGGKEGLVKMWVLNATRFEKMITIILKNPRTPVLLRGFTVEETQWVRQLTNTVAGRDFNYKAKRQSCAWAHSACERGPPLCGLLSDRKDRQGPRLSTWWQACWCACVISPFQQLYKR